jgi:hypothetical protein
MEAAAESGVTDFAFMTDAIEAMKTQIAAPITVKVNFDLSDMPNVAGWIDQFAAGNRTTGYNNNDHLSASNFATYEDWEANFLQRNPGDEHRAREAYDNIPGRAGGSPNLMPEWWGAGTMVRLHGRETVVPEGREQEFAERHGLRSDATTRELVALRAEMARDRRMFPTMIATAIRDHVQIGRR